MIRNLQVIFVMKCNTLVPVVSDLRHTSSSTFFDRNTSFLFSEDLFCLRGCMAFGRMLWNLLTKVSGKSKRWDLRRSTWNVVLLHHLDLEGALDCMHLLTLDPAIRIILVSRLAIDFIIFIIIIRSGFS